MLHDLLHMGVPAGEKAVRTVAVYAGILLLLRVAGKRQLAQLNALDLVVLLLLSNVVQNAIIGPDNSLAGGLLGAVVLVAVNYLLVQVTARSERATRLVQGPSTLLVDGGQLQDRALRRELITERELDSALRREGVDGGWRDCERVTIEPEGAITPERRPQPGIEDVLERLDRIESALARR